MAKKAASKLEEPIEKQLWKAADKLQKDKLRELAVVLFERVKANTSIDWTIKKNAREAQGDRQAHATAIWLSAGHAGARNQDDT